MSTLPYYKYQKKNKSINKPLRLLLLILVLIVGVGAILQTTKVIHFFGKSEPLSKVIVKAGKTTPVKDAIKKNVSANKEAPKIVSVSNNTIGGDKDTHGTAATSSSTSSSQWVTSASGAITVEQPTANSDIYSGSILSGKAKVSQVQYTLIDNLVGVISEGSLNVVNGRFSGTINFTPKASNGRLDVYSTESNGAQINEIQIEIGLR